MARNVIEGRMDLWSVPIQDRVFDGVIEGVPSPQMQAERRAECRAKRAAWSPGHEAMAYVERLRREAAGRIVVVRAWEKIMFMLEDEGPYPVRAACRDVMAAPDGEGKVHAYLVLSDLQVVRQPLGSDQTERFFIGPADSRYRFDLGDLLEPEVHER